MNTEVGLPIASDAPNDDIAGVPQLAVLRDEPFPKTDSDYVNNAPDEAPAVPSVTEATPDPMAVHTSVSPVLNMDDLQVVFTTSDDPTKWIPFSRVTPAAVVGKLTKKPPKEKTEAKIDHFNPEIVDKASDNTRALDDDEIQAARHAFSLRLVQEWQPYRAIYFQGIRRMVWTTQRCTRAFWIVLSTSYSNEGQRVEWDQPETPFYYEECCC